MIGKEIIVEGTSFYYDLDFEYQVLLEKEVLIITNDALDFLSKDIVSNFCRPVLTSHYQKDKYFLDYLFWFDDTCLAEIDQKVIANSFSNEDFERSVKTQFYKNIFCMKCGSNRENVLVVDSILIYPNNFDLGDKKRKNIIEDNKFILCSNCNNRFNMAVVHFF